MKVYKITLMVDDCTNFDNETVVTKNFYDACRYGMEMVRCARLEDPEGIYEIEDIQLLNSDVSVLR